MKLHKREQKREFDSSLSLIGHFLKGSIGIFIGIQANIERFTDLLAERAHGRERILLFSVYNTARERDSRAVTIRLFA